ncbi:MAG TPA: histidine kinase [Nocardioidaceae bacterium]|nr:histidine kinase [Nocardioidaceae bacterium]
MVTPRQQVAVAARLVALATLLVVVLLEPSVRQDTASRGPVAAVVAIGLLSAYLARTSGPRAARSALATETVVVSVATGLAPEPAALMPYLVVLPLLAGLQAALPGVAAALGTEVVGACLVPLLLAEQSWPRDGSRWLDLAPWLGTALGIGLLGAWLRRRGVPGLAEDNDAYYESARQLLTQLRSVTRRLSAGLDSQGMAAAVLEAMHQRLGDSGGALFISLQSPGLVPFAHRGPDAQQLLVLSDPLVERCRAEARAIQGIVLEGPTRARHRVVLPLRVGTRVLGVAVSCLPQAPAAETVTSLLHELDEHSLRLDAALVFDEVRTLATADERQRLAREIHDGIAQEVASLGYVLDDLAASADPTLARGLHELRGELSRVVGDLRLSIFDLRSDVSAANGLGAALSDYVRQVGARSDLTVHLTLDEAPSRLAPAVEAELLRIAQEAITNARRHASARHLWVDCWTDPPRASLVVRDDGSGIHGRGEDSYGIAIMRERADRIDATIDIVSDPATGRPGGTVVEVTVADRRSRAPEEVSAR